MLQTGNGVKCVKRLLHLTIWLITQSLSGLLFFLLLNSDLALVVIDAGQFHGKTLYWEQYDIEYRIIWLVRDPSDVISEQWGQGSARRQRWGWEKLLSCGRTILGRPMKHWTNNSEYTVRETLHKTTNLLSLYRTSKNVFSSMMKHFGLLWRIYFIIVWEFR